MENLLTSLLLLIWFSYLVYKYYKLIDAQEGKLMSNFAIKNTIMTISAFYALEYFGEFIIELIRLFVK